MTAWSVRANLTMYCWWSLMITVIVISGLRRHHAICLFLRGSLSSILVALSCLFFIYKDAGNTWWWSLMISILVATKAPAIFILFWLDWSAGVRYWRLVKAG